MEEYLWWLDVVLFDYSIKTGIQKSFKLAMRIEDTIKSLWLDWSQSGTMTFNWAVWIVYWECYEVFL